MDARFGFLLFNEFEDMDFVGPWEMIGQWGLNYGGPQEFFTISEKGGVVKSVLGLSILTNFSFDNCPPLDFLLVPGGLGTRKEVNNSKLITFIKNNAKHCKEVLSVCTGTFLLQAAELLKNKKATTHWASMDQLREFSEIEVVKQRFVQDGQIWSSAGVSAGIDLALAFIAYMAGNEVARKVQQYTEYYPIDKKY